MSSFIRSLAKEYVDILENDTYRIINDEEQFILFESNREQLLVTNNLYESPGFTTRSVLRNINLLKSLEIAPEEYAKRLHTLMNQNKTVDCKRYTDFGTIYALYDQFLQDRKFLTLNDVINKVKKDVCTMNAIAQVSFLFSNVYL